MRVAASSAANPRQPGSALAQRREEAFAAGPLAERLGRRREAVDVQIGEQALLVHPTPAGARIHHLDEAAVLAPNNEKVRHPVRQAHHDQRRQRVRLAQQEMVGRDHDLLGVEAKLDRDLLDDINRGAVHLGLARLAQAAEARRDAVALQQRLEGRRAAIHL